MTIWMMALALQAAPMAAPAACPTTPAALPAVLAGWATPAPVAAADGHSRSGFTMVSVGKAATLMLLPTAKVAFAVAPEKPGDPSANAGLVGFTIATAGTYRVALGAGVWIDVVQGGKAVASTAHGHGPACSGVRKMVDFALTPGQYVLQVSGSKNATVAVMVVKV